MKKLSILPLAALLMLGACSDDTPDITIPDKPVQTQQPVADNVTLNVPKQTSPKFTADGSLYMFDYENGQQIVYSMTTTGAGQRVAVVKKILGKASEVTIPYTVEGMIADNQTAQWDVVGIDLYTEAVAPNVTKITLPKTCSTYLYKDAYVAVGAQQMRELVARAYSVAAIELEDGYPGFVSINGAIYTQNMKSLVAVPRAFKGEFTVASGTETIQEKAFDHPSPIDIVTLPASVKAIGSEAMTFAESLLVVNILADEAPTAYVDTFGNYLTTNGVLRIKKGTKASYEVAKPTLEKPVAPVEPASPDMDATQEEWDQYDADVEEYNKRLDEYTTLKEAYDAAWEAYKAKEGYKNFSKIEERDF